MTPSALLLTSVAGLASFALGATILVSIGRAGFRRRNPYGRLVFRSYGPWLVFRGAAAVMRPLGILLLLNGSVLLLTALNAPADAWHASTPVVSASWKAAVHE